MLRILSLCLFIFFLICRSSAEPLSKPYIAYRTDPFDQPSCHRLPLNSPLPSVQPRPYQYDEVPSYKCPLQMTLGIAQQQQQQQYQGGADRDAAIIAPPVLFPLRGGTLGSHALCTTAYEHLHVLQPGVMERPSSSKSNKHHSTTTSTSTTSTHSSFKELLVEPPTFPLLLESSAYLTSPVFARWCECRWIVGCHGGRLRWRIESLGHFHTPQWRRSIIIIILVSTSWTSPPYVSTT